MTLDDAIQRAQFIRPEHKGKLRECLEKLHPDCISKWLYGTHREYDTLYQGDILKEIPVCFIDEDGDVISGTDYVAMISNTCDMQPNRKETIIVSPIVTLADYKEDLIENKVKNVDSKLEDIKKNKIISKFYLPHNGIFPESFVDFSSMVTVNSIFVNRVYRDKELLSLISIWFLFFPYKAHFPFC
ncbi:hypothetical protein MBAV_000961 [Candidatus Magnetobacterium bavaricum]|uniref:Uncharacterized protein n=1 Tax=Candidatus Magnetobacterium bavaricum TaxID=29290 RepID=A0A0F3GYD6_9BACT|nr:hypothetical protein MBAV_000961 [Candidatus Magnetobacterium bavaricum]